MSPYDEVIGRLEGFRRTGSNRGVARCPAHKDRRPSLSVREFNTGAVGLHCFAGCDVEAIVGALGLRMEDLFPPRAEDPARVVRGDPRPYSVRDLIEALHRELLVVWIVLGDLAEGQNAFSDADRRRAGLARERCLALLSELRLAR